MDYYYSQDGSRWVGPVSAKGLKDLARQGVVTPMSLLMSPDRIPPTSAHKAQGLFEAEPLPSAIESMPDEVQAKSIFGSAFSLVSGAVSTVSTAIIPVRSRSVAPVEPPTAPPVPVSASPVVAPVVVNCPVPVVEDVIGPFVFSPQGGTQIKGTIDKRFNAVIPGGLVAGKVELFVHQDSDGAEKRRALCHPVFRDESSQADQAWRTASSNDRRHRGGLCSRIPHFGAAWSLSGCSHVTARNELHPRFRIHGRY